MGRTVALKNKNINKFSVVCIYQFLGLFAAMEARFSVALLCPLYILEGKADELKTWSTIISLKTRGKSRVLILKYVSPRVWLE